jgi:hypothetical protein
MSTTKVMTYCSIIGRSLLLFLDSCFAVIDCIRKENGSNGVPQDSHDQLHRLIPRRTFWKVSSSIRQIYKKKYSVCLHIIGLVGFSLFSIEYIFWRFRFWEKSLFENHGNFKGKWFTINYYVFELVENIILFYKINMRPASN